MWRVQRPPRFSNVTFVTAIVFVFLFLLYHVPSSSWDPIADYALDYDPSKPLFPSDYYRSLSRPTFCSSVPEKPSFAGNDLRDVKLAQPLSPRDLMCRDLETNRTTVPKYIHQSWKTRDLPAKFETWSETCRAQHAEWEWVLWTDEDNLALVRAFFPALEATYNALPHTIYRADLARNLYMYMFGGVYADLDMECLRPTEAVLDETVLQPNEITTLLPRPSSPRRLAVFGRMGQNPSFAHSVPNAWMAASPFHPLFLRPPITVLETSRRFRSPLYAYLHFWPGAEYLTGPVALKDNIETYEPAGEDDGRVVVLPESWVYPYDWKVATRDRSTWSLCSARSEQFDQKLCKEVLGTEAKGSIAITYWSHSWG